MTAQLQELLLRLPPSAATDEIQNICEALMKERKEMERCILNQQHAMKLCREILRSPANNIRFMQIANPARQCLNILNPFFEK